MGTPFCWNRLKACRRGTGQHPLQKFDQQRGHPCRFERETLPPLPKPWFSLNLRGIPPKKKTKKKPPLESWGTATVMSVTKKPSGSKSNRGTPRKALLSLATKIHEKPEQEHQGPNRKTPSNKNRGKKAGGGGNAGFDVLPKKAWFDAPKTAIVQKVKTCSTGRPPPQMGERAFMLKTSKAQKQDQSATKGHLCCGKWPGQ